MIFKDYLKLPEIASNSKLAQVSKSPPPDGIGGRHLEYLKVFRFYSNLDYNTSKR